MLIHFISFYFVLIVFGCITLSCLVSYSIVLYHIVLYCVSSYYIVTEKHCHTGEDVEKQVLQTHCLLPQLLQDTHGVCFRLCLKSYQCPLLISSIDNFDKLL